jgi:hypothetical protein
MKHIFTSLAGIVVLTAACSGSNKTVPAPPHVCAPADCAADNQCISDGAETKCRRPCTLHTDCPGGYQCLNNPTQPGPAYCVKNTTDIPSKPTGQWGTPCLPNGGDTDNPACDKDNKFVCLGYGTTDATAYCTHADCASDLDCIPGYWCATVDDKPNVTDSVRSFGKTHTVCTKHEYCSPCGGDRDCPIIDGKQSHCAPDDVGGLYCAPPCTADANCRLDAACNNTLENGTKVCKPRAGTCKGDGTLCSPCRSDADCPDGYCLKGNYSPERFCSVKAGAMCVSGTKSDCPAFTAMKGTTIGCQSDAGDENIPRNQCIGIVPFADNADVGCWTKHE